MPALRPVWIESLLHLLLCLPEASEPNVRDGGIFLELNRFTIQQCLPPLCSVARLIMKSDLGPEGRRLGEASSLSQRLLAYVQFILPQWKDEKVILQDY